VGGGELFSALQAWSKREGQRGPRAFVGFDGFVDTMYRVVRERGAAGAVFFDTIRAFARHVEAAAGQSADIELVHQETRLGGNGPLLANALAALGVSTTCAGAMGYPRLRPAFAGMDPACEKLTLCEPGECSAYEFSDGKLMFADLAPLDALDWPLVKERAGLGRLRERIGGSDLVALVDWGGLVKAQGVWEGLAEEVLLQTLPDRGTPRRLFIDLADISKRTSSDVKAMLGLLRRCAGRWDVTLGLNEHEAWALLARTTAATSLSLEEACRALFDALGLHAVVIHPIDRSYAVSREGLVMRAGSVVASPLASTGGGDNFNAGYCLGWLMGLAQEHCLDLGMTVSRMYVGTGRSPGIPALMNEIAGN